MKTSSTQEIKFVPKGWGFEKWFHNSEKYCGKLLYFVKGKKCSYHLLSSSKKKKISKGKLPQMDAEN